jgi:hypothetical protein
MSPATARQHERELLAGLAAKTQEKIPALNGRISKACRLVLAGDVELQGAKALVHSLSDPAKTYTLEPGHCTCADFPRAPESLCAHRLAVGFQRKIQELLARETPPVPVSSTDGENLPEAPASCNVRVLVGGHEVQWTLRGHDEAEVFTRLQTLLKRSDVQPLPKPAPRQGPWQRRHQGR